MQKPFKQFMFRLVVLTVVLLVATLAIFNFAIHHDFTIAYWFIFIYFFGMTSLVHFLLLRAGGADEEPKKFVPKFMGVLGLKMFASLLYIFIYSFMFTEDMFAFAITFICVYLSYTTLEVVSILGALKD